MPPCKTDLWGSSRLLTRVLESLLLVMTAHPHAQLSILGGDRSPVNTSDRVATVFHKSDLCLLLLGWGDYWLCA